jgi:hypothetical protein
MHDNTRQLAKWPNEDKISCAAGEERVARSESVEAISRN